MQYHGITLQQEINQSYLELLRLQIEAQRMQNEVMRSLMSNNILRNTAVIKYNLIARSWNALNKAETPPPTGMYG